MTNNLAIASLPRSGLANRLFVWARAYTFSRLHDVPLYVHGWGHFNLSPILRGDRSFRFYYPYFVSRTNHLGFAVRRLLAAAGFHSVQTEDEILSQDIDATDRTVWLFKGVPWYEDYFVAHRGYETLIREGFFEMVKPRVMELVDAQPRPVVALHIRRGDFQIARELTGNEYFIDSVRRIRAASREQLPVTVFSDAKDEQISDVLSLPGVCRQDSGNDVADLISLSKADVIVTSFRSTYGYWGGYLSDAAIILDPRHGDARIRSDDPKWFDGTLDEYCRQLSGRQRRIASH